MVQLSGKVTGSCGSYGGDGTMLKCALLRSPYAPAELLESRVRSGVSSCSGVRNVQAVPSTD